MTLVYLNTLPISIFCCSSFQTRQELLDALESEIQAFLQDRELAGGTLISWNFTEFSVVYQSLAEEIKIGDYFLRLLLEEDQVSITICYLFRESNH